MSKFTGFINGFGQGMVLADRAESMKERKEQKAALKDIANASPEQSTGYTAEQGEELRRAAESGQYDIGWDESQQAYTLTPKTDPTQTGVIAQQGVTDFLGNRTAGSMSEDQVTSARQRAMTGVISRTDPVTGARMAREAKSSERDDQRFGWEQRRAEREDRKFTQEEDRDRFMKGLESEVGQFMQSRMTGPDGHTRPATVDDYLAASQFKAAKLIESGKMDDAAAIMKDYNAQSFVKIQLETAERDKALGETIAAVNAGNLDAARGFYDKFLPDGAQVTEVKQGRDGRIVVERQSATGQPIPPMTFTDVNQMTASLAALKDPMAVYNWSQNEFRNNLALRADARAERADGRSAANSRSGRQDEAARVTAATALFQERNPNATPTEIEAVRRGVLPAVPKTDQKFVTEAGDITSLLGDPATDSRGQPLMDPMTGRQVMNRNQKRERELFEFMQQNNIRDTNEGIQRFITAKKQGQESGGAQRVAKGQVVNGYEFLGGDPKVQKNWRQVARGTVQ